MQIYAHTPQDGRGLRVYTKIDRYTYIHAYICTSTANLRRTFESWILSWEDASGYVMYIYIYIYIYIYR